MACVEVCHVDCIVQFKGDDPKFPHQLYIDPDECINCGVCEPECPWEAIFEDEQVPEIFSADTVLNADIVNNRDDFEVPEHEDLDPPTPEQVEENRQKWGYTA